SILDRKTQRLKVLIEDLFEASKVASGAIELNIEKIDVAALLTQTLAEFDEKIKDSSLTFRVNGTNKKIYANLDGKKTWRVFDNLINNALKYSQENTRVYIDLIEYDNKVTLTVKNISSYEMDFNVEEIFERFKRGDKSRNTDGSGLGLAIAKSIVELQGGKLDIEIDGDLFKAIVKFYK
ncbi:MAG: ATP-binding protein, partial [Clostridium sp.]|nr:ATP-binding protein [Clostridium sp.]